MTAPIKTCDYCGATGEMPTFMNGETICYTCMHVLPKTLPEARQELMRLRALLDVVAQPAPSVPNGWKEAAIAWEVCASIHREYGKGKDPFFNTRQGDFIKHANDARAMLAAAPKQEAQPAPSEQDESVRKSWVRFSNELHRSPDAPYPGMSEAFELHFSQPFTDRDWHAESGTWAAAWIAAKQHGAKTVLRVPDAVIAALDNLDDYMSRIEGNDRGACNHINLIHRYLVDATEVGENK